MISVPISNSPKDEASLLKNEQGEQCERSEAATDLFKTLSITIGPKTIRWVSKVNKYSNFPLLLEQ